jgi:hypothetical protein
MYASQPLGPIVRRIWTRRISVWTIMPPCARVKRRRPPVFPWPHLSVYLVPNPPLSLSDARIDSDGGGGGGATLTRPGASSLAHIPALLAATRADAQWLTPQIWRRAREVWISKPSYWIWVPISNPPLSLWRSNPRQICSNPSVLCCSFPISCCLLLGLGCSP